MLTLPLLPASLASSEGAAPDRIVQTRIKGPEPGYAACSIFVVEAAFVVLDDEIKECDFGVRTTGELLAGTTYLDRLRSRGIVIDEVVQEP